MIKTIKKLVYRFLDWAEPDINLNYKNKKQCNCGLITSDRVSDYSIVIRNSCSGNEKRFTLAPGDWVNAHVGSDYCITNSGRW
jgi:hypothetical protein